MGIIATHPELIKLYYSTATDMGKFADSYTLQQKMLVLSIDVAQTNIPGSHWAEIADCLSVDIKQLVNRKHPNFIKNFGHEEVNFSSSDWLFVLQHHPETLAFPIVMIGKEVFLLKKPSDFGHHL